MNTSNIVDDERHQIFLKCVTKNMIRFKDFKAYEVANILFMWKSEDFFKRINGFKRQMRAMKFKSFFIITAFCTKVCSLTHKIKWGIWNEKSNCILPSSLAKKKLCPYKSCCIVLVTHIQFPNTFSFELISKNCNAGLLAWK